MRHAHSGKIPFDCPFFSTAGHTLTREPVKVGCSKVLGLLTVCPLARRKKGRMGFCYVRYCRGAGSYLASPTLALLEGLCRLQAACVNNQPIKKHQHKKRLPAKAESLSKYTMPRNHPTKIALFFCFFSFLRKEKKKPCRHRLTRTTISPSSGWPNTSRPFIA